MDTSQLIAFIHSEMNIKLFLAIKRSVQYPFPALILIRNLSWPFHSVIFQVLSLVSFITFNLSFLSYLGCKLYVALLKLTPEQSGRGNLIGFPSRSVWNNI